MIQHLSSTITHLRNEITVLELKVRSQNLFLLKLVLSPFTSLRNYSNGRYWGQIQHRMLNGNGVLNYYNGHYYIGSWFNEKFHGQGMLVDDRGTYEGSFSDGKRNGYGTQKFKDGESMVGWWEDDKFAGGDYYRVVKPGYR